jgi:DNA-binding LytR/AlgR family response regulator
MKDIKNILLDYFVRIHKFYFVNLEHAELVDINVITMSNGEELMIFRENLNAFNEVYR